MEIITQATVGLAKFLHPDYVSAARLPWYSKVIDFSDGINTQLEMYVMIFSVMITLIIGIFIANYMSILIKRIKVKR